MKSFNIEETIFCIAESKRLCSNINVVVECVFNFQNGYLISELLTESKRVKRTTYIEFHNKGGMMNGKTKSTI